MNIVYANKNVEKYFTDFSKLKKKLPFDWVRRIKKHLDNLEAAECFGDFLKVGLGHPEQLAGYENVRYSLRVSANARLIIEPKAENDMIMICSLVEIEGVSDYHGEKENWYIS